MIAGPSSGVGWWDFTVPSCVFWIFENKTPYAGRKRDTIPNPKLPPCIRAMLIPTSCLVPSHRKPIHNAHRAHRTPLRLLYASDQARFYMSCANVKITGSGNPHVRGSYTPNSLHTRSAILLNIYDSNPPSLPNKAGKSYTIPDPAKLAC
ncbi:hypothetical protein LOCC1_G003529 [Lachnellula occidentalis]|uniref:Endo-beta-1,4-glucanase D n=1 Tax=Lachnellula occidentalis TaxID=215460 RepID=A0A8H8S023_9HELO|nr:hypothetical protein LOCC1_G003529 [Lachnellula occidentalis]